MMECLLVMMFTIYMTRQQVTNDISRYLEDHSMSLDGSQNLPVMCQSCQ